LRSYDSIPPGGSSPALQVPAPLPRLAAILIRRTSSGVCRPGIPNPCMSALATFEVSRSRIVGCSAICASSTRSTCSRVRPSATKRSTKPLGPTLPPALSTTAKTLTHTEQTVRQSPARLRQYKHRIRSHHGRRRPPAAKTHEARIAHPNRRMPRFKSINTYVCRWQQERAKRAGHCSWKARSAYRSGPAGLWLDSK